MIPHWKDSHHSPLLILLPLSSMMLIKLNQDYDNFVASLNQYFQAMSLYLVAENREMNPPPPFLYATMHAHLVFNYIIL